MSAGCGEWPLPVVEELDPDVSSVTARMPDSFCYPASQPHHSSYFQRAQ